MIRYDLEIMKSLTNNSVVLGGNPSPAGLLHRLPKCHVSNSDTSHVYCVL